jgi:hypothetical protein
VIGLRVRQHRIAVAKAKVPKPPLPPPPPILRRAAIELIVAGLMREHARCFDGWPTSRVYDPTSHIRRVYQIRALEPALRRVGVEDLFEAVSTLVATRRTAHRSKYRRNCTDTEI